MHHDDVTHIDACVASHLLAVTPISYNVDVRIRSAQVPASYKSLSRAACLLLSIQNDSEPSCQPS